MASMLPRVAVNDVDRLSDVSGHRLSHAVHGVCGKQPIEPRFPLDACDRHWHRECGRVHDHDQLVLGNGHDGGQVAHTLSAALSSLTAGCVPALYPRLPARSPARAKSAPTLAVPAPWLVVGSTRLMSGLVPPVRETANVGSLTGMLHRVPNHTDQPDRGGHRRIPMGIDDPIQLLGSNAIQVAQRQFVNISVIVAEEVATHPDRRYLLRALAVTGSPLVKGQSEPLPPLRPHLLNLRQVGHLIVLAAGEVPEQPGNRIGFRIRAVGGDFVSQTVGEVHHELAYPPECVSQNLLRIFSHITEPYWLRLLHEPMSARPDSRAGWCGGTLPRDSPVAATRSTAPGAWATLQGVRRGR